MREWLKKARCDKGLTMKEIASKLGISESYYSLIENGERQKKMDVLLMSGLSTVLDIPVSQIAKTESEEMCRQ